MVNNDRRRALAEEAARADVVRTYTGLRLPGYTQELIGGEVFFRLGSRRISLYQLLSDPDFAMFQAGYEARPGSGHWHTAGFGTAVKEGKLAFIRPKREYDN